jgi:heat shock protein HslJ
MTRTLPLLLALAAACAGRGNGPGPQTDPDQSAGEGWVQVKQDADGPGQEITLRGTVRHLALEGGVWVIEDAAGTRYTPMNLPDGFQQDGMTVEAEGRRRDDVMSVSMVGPMVELLRIRERSGGSASPAPSAPSSLTGRTWVLEDLSGAGVIDDAQATLDVAQDGRVSGRATCNRFSGSATIAGDAITFGPLATTRMACAEALMNQEQNYLAALAQAKQWEVQGSTLFIHVGGGSEPLRFTAQ